MIYQEVPSGTGQQTRALVSGQQLEKGGRSRADATLVLAVLQLYGLTTLAPVSSYRASAKPHSLLVGLQTEWQEGDSSDGGLFASPRADGTAAASGGLGGKSDEVDPLGLMRGGVLA